MALTHFPFNLDWRTVTALRLEHAATQVTQSQDPAHRMGLTMGNSASCYVTSTRSVTTAISKAPLKQSA